MSLSIEQSDFFVQMAEFGFFDRIEKTLPKEFTLVYQIARILNDESHRLTQQLAPIMWNAPTDSPPQTSPETETIPNIPVAEEYEPNLIESYRDIPRIYPYQFLLPDEAFYQKLAERSLWTPKPRVPRNYSFQTDADIFAPDSRKQKVYILFDSSKSMQEHFRAHIAKAIVYFFLDRNKKELGTVYFRTFDAEIGELHTAYDAASYERLIAYVMRLQSHGRGTAMGKALETAVDDIRLYALMAETEILTITDGAAHFDAESMKEKLGSSIKVNCIKIGDAAITPDEKHIKNLIMSSDSEQAEQLRKLFDRKNDLLRQEKLAQSGARKSVLEGELRHVEKMIVQLSDRFAQQTAGTYGREIELISTKYINVPDVDPMEIFGLDEERKQLLTELAKEIIEALQQQQSANAAKQAAMLYDHIKVLVDHNKTQTAELAEINSELKKIIDSMMQSNSELAAAMELTDDDRIQIGKLLQQSSGLRRRISLASLLLHVFRKIRKIYFRWRAHRRLKRIRKI